MKNNNNRELLNYIGKLVDQRVAKPENDLISKLVVEQVRALGFTASTSESPC